MCHSLIPKKIIGVVVATNEVTTAYKPFYRMGVFQFVIVEQCHWLIVEIQLLTDLLNAKYDFWIKYIAYKFIDSGDDVVVP